MMRILFALFLLTLVGCGKRPSAQPAQDYENALKKYRYGKNEKAGRYYDIRGFRMYCEIYGHGGPLVMVHGNGGDISNFVMQIPYFAKKYKVIVPDSRAQGKSIDKNDSLSYEMMADDVSELLRQLNVKRANVMGWSDGGISALLLAERHPEKVNKLVVTGANIWPGASALEAGEWVNMQNGFQEIEAKMKSAQPKTAADSLGYKLQKLMIENPHLSKANLIKITAPVLVVGGDHDMIRPEHTLAIYRMLPHAQLWILPNSGHATLLSYAEEVNKRPTRSFRQPSKSERKTNGFFRLDVTA